MSIALVYLLDQEDQVLQRGISAQMGWWAEMRAKAPFGVFQGADDDKGQCEIENRRQEKQFVGREGTRDDDPRNAGDVQERNRAGERAAFENEDDFIAVGRQGEAKSTGNSDAAQY